MKRFLAILLICALILTLLPTAMAAEEKADPAPLTQEDYITADLMWEAVNAKEAQMLTKKAPMNQTIEALIAEVTSSPYYEENSLIRNGDHFFWETTDGIPCGYSPRLAERARNATALEGYDIATAETVLTTSYATKGGSPGNRDAFLIQPYYGIDSSFTTQYVTEADNIANALGGTATTYRTTSATIDIIADSIEAGAVVIFDSHGDTDYANGDDCSSRANTSYICLQTNGGLTSKDYEVATGKFGQYYHAYYAGSYNTMKYYCVDGTAIANHMENTSSNGLLWMAICLGMATDGLHAPLRKKGVEVAYGYSQSVTFDYDYDWEKAFWSQMILGKTVAESISYMKQRVGLWDWCHASDYDTIAEAREMYCAFPIVVSSEDLYPGHGNVDDLQSVNSTWTLAAECTHSTVNFVSSSPATCTEDGNIAYYQCSDCKAVFTDEALTNRIGMAATVVAATGHSYDEGKITTVSTCTTDGVLTYTCGSCGDSYTELLPAEGHQYAEGFCTLCGYAKPMVTEFSHGVSGTFILAAKVKNVYYAMPNTYTDKSGKFTSIVVDASEGFVEEEFATDTALELTFDAATGRYTIHNGSFYLRYPSSTNVGGISTPYYWTLEQGVNGTWQVVSETTTRILCYRGNGYNTFGGYYRQNVVPGGTEYFDIEIIPVAKKNQEGETCKHTNTTQTTNSPTCTTDGSLLLICDDCGGTVNSQILPATGHSWIAGAVETAPGCTTVGSQLYSCESCRETRTEILPATGHSWNEGVITTEPTCSQAGVKTYTCTLCSQSKTEELPETEHSWDEGVVSVEPSCSVAGIQTFSCVICSATKTEPIPSTSHNFVNGTCTNCGYGYAPEGSGFQSGQAGSFVLAANVNGTYYAMSNTFPTGGKIKSVEIAPVNGYVLEADAEGIIVELDYNETEGTYTIFNGTSYLSYTSSTNIGSSEEPYEWTISQGTNGSFRILSGTSDRALIFRGASYNQFGGYSIKNISEGGNEYFDMEILPIYTYIPGDDIETPETPIDHTIVINHTLNLASDISINYAVLTTLLEDYDSFYLSCEVPIYNGRDYEGSNTVTIEPVLNGNFYYFTLKGITAVQMGDEVEATLYMTKDGQTYASNTDVYSVAAYAYGQLNKESISESLKKLCAELLRYGAYAQSYKGYRDDSPVDENLTQEHYAYFTDLETITFNQNNQVLDDLTDPTVTWAGKTLNLDSKVILKFIANLSSYTGDPKDLSLKVTYKNYKGENVELIIPEATVYFEPMNYYAFDLDSLLAAELRCVVTAAVYCGDTQVSPSVQYSADAYAVGKTGSLLELCKALMSYSDTALAYFTQK